MTIKSCISPRAPFKAFGKSFLTRISAAMAAALCAFAFTGVAAHEAKLPSSEDYAGIFNLLGIETPGASKKEAKVSAALLVSFSMPQSSLEKLARDAKDAGIPLVFRGVPKTEDEKEPASARKLIDANALKAFEPLIALGASVELNPEVFTEHNVRQVPALLLKEEASKDCSSCAPASKAVLVRGDVTLGYLLDRVVDRKDAVGQKAAALRAKLGGRN